MATFGMSSSAPGGLTQQLNLPGMAPAGALSTGGAFGSAGAGGSVQQSQSTSQQGSQSGDYFNNPNLVNALSGSIGGLGQQMAGQYQNFLADPTSHPYFANALSGLLGALRPGEMDAQRNLMDMFRAGGNTASSTFGHEAQGLIANQDRNRAQLASQLLTTMFPQMTQAMQQPMTLAEQLISALKMNQSSSAGTSNSTSSGLSSQAGSGAGAAQPPNIGSWIGSPSGNLYRSSASYR